MLLEREAKERTSMQQVVCHLALSPDDYRYLTRKHSRVFCYLHDTAHIVVASQLKIARHEYSKAAQKWAKEAGMKVAPHLLSKERKNSVQKYIGHHYMGFILAEIERGMISLAESKKSHDALIAKERAEQAAAKAERKAREKAEREADLEEKRIIKAAKIAAEVGHISVKDYNGKYEAVLMSGRKVIFTAEQAREYYVCGGKNVYLMKSQAIEDRSDPSMDVYCCVFCSGWHQGHKNPTGPTPMTPLKLKKRILTKPLRAEKYVQYLEATKQLVS